MELQCLKTIFFLAIFGISHWNVLILVNAGIIPHRLPSGQINENLNYKQRYSESDSGESKTSKSNVRTNIPDAAAEKYPQFNPNGTDERREERRDDSRSGGRTGGGTDSFYTTGYPTYTRLGRPVTWEPPLPTTKMPPPPLPPQPGTTVPHQPRVGGNNPKRPRPTIIVGNMPAQIKGHNSRQESVDSSINGQTESSIGLVAGVFVGIFLIVGVLTVFNIQCVKSRFRQFQHLQL
ncbi:uncharacterized protein [Antedon mediterranea]|uniref:uncharacterized protein n=1 Tax=Antedon mediterranea TaxID=105859 RepID=UPI003AF588D9